MTDHGLKKFYAVPRTADMADLYVEEDSYREMLRSLLPKLIADPEKDWQRYEICAREMIVAAKNVSAHLDADPAVLWQAYDVYTKIFLEFCHYLIGSFAVEEFVVPEVTRKFPKESTFIIASELPFYYQQLERDLFVHDIDSVQQDYGWMNVYNFFDEDYTVDYFKTIRSHLSKPDVDKIFQGIAATKKQFQIFIDNLNDETWRTKSLLAHRYAFIKTDRVDRWRMAMCELRSFFQMLSERLGVPGNLVLNMQHQEIKEFLLEGRQPSIEELERRSSPSTIMEITGRNVMMISEPKEVERVKVLVREKVSGDNVRTGVVASPGKATGKIAVVMYKHEVHKVNDGDILVAIWTTPDYVPAMKKAAAIITEEGGLTSHAAIISRELGKPCLLNVKNATEFFKDGDLVEVDAEQGFIQKI